MTDEATALDASVVLLASAEPTVSKFGTGFVIANQPTGALVVTCAHVVLDVGGPTRVRVAGQPVEVVALGALDQVDLALLRVPGLRAPALRVGPAAAGGRGFVSAGFHRYAGLHIVRQITGTLGAHVGLEGRAGADRIRAREVLIDAPARLLPGFSGAPVLDPSRGVVSGVISHREGEGQRGLAISIAGLAAIWPEVAQLWVPSEPSTPRVRHAESFADRTPLFVGRDIELNRLARHCADALNGRGHVDFICGDAGSGKTALAMRLLATQIAADPQWLVAFADAGPATGRTNTCGLFKETLEQLTSADVTGGPQPLDLVAEVVSGIGITDLGPLASFAGAATRRLQLRLRELVGAEGVANTATIIDQGALFDCYAKAIATIARSYPLLIVLDDLQWADESSLLLLQHLGRMIEFHRIMVVCTFRRDEVLDNPVLNEVHDRLVWLGAATVDLREPPEEAGGNEPLRRFCADYLMARYQTIFSPELVAALFQLTKANPLFLAETLVNLEERGYLHKGDEGWVLARSINNMAELPDRLEVVLRQRIGRLDETLVSILKQGSVEGSEFTAEVISRIQGVDERSLRSLIVDKLMRAHHLVLAGLRRRTLAGASLHTFAFSHGLTHRYVYEYLLTPLEREMLHEEVGYCLEALWGDDANDIAAQLATHFSHTPRTAKTVGYALVAAQAATREYGWSEAVRFARLGLDAAQDHPAVDPMDVVRLRLVYATAESEGGVSGGSTDHIESGLAVLRPCLAQVDAMPPELGAQVFLVMGKLTAAKEVAGEYHGNPYYDEAARRYEQLGDLEGTISALSLGCYDTNLASQQDGARQLAIRTRCVALAERVGKPALIAKTLCDLALHYLVFDTDVEAPLRAAEGHADLAYSLTTGTNPIGELTALLMLSWIYHHQGRYDELGARRERVLERARALGQTTMEAEALTDVGHYRSLLMDDPVAAERAMRAALEFRRRTGRHSVIDHENLAALVLRRASFAEGITLLEEALTEQGDDRAARTRGTIAHMLALTGQDGRARQVLAETSIDEELDLAAPMLAWAAVGEHDQALRLAALVARQEPAAARRGLFHVYSDNATSLARVYLTAGHLDDAAAWIQQAAHRWADLAEHTEVRRLVMYWEHRLVLGMVHAARGESQAARPVLDEVYQQLSAFGHYARVEALVGIGNCLLATDGELARERLAEASALARTLGLVGVAATTNP